MTSVKLTKRSLFVTLVSIFLCVCAFVGTTFAWFTDSETSGTSIISSGNLDLELSYWDGDSWEDAVDVSLFEPDALWEPGHTETAYLQIENVGDLAFTYLFAVYPTTEQQATNQAGEKFYLSDHLQFGVVQNVDAEAGEVYQTRKDAATAIAGNAIGLQRYLKVERLLPGEKMRVALVVRMPESVGNEANFASDSVGAYVNLAVSVFATQHPYEEDSFDFLYDAGLEPEWEPPVWRYLPDSLVVDKVNKTITVMDAEALKYLSTWFKDMQHLSTSNPEYDPADWTVQLGADIDMEGEVLDAPIDIGQYYVFDGKAYTIKNVVVNYAGAGSAGLFANMPSTTNLKLDNIEINAPNADYVGVMTGTVVAGTTYDHITIGNSTATGAIYVGGLFGWFDLFGAIDFPYIEIFKTDLFGDYVGGYGGYISSTGSVNATGGSVSELGGAAQEAAGGLFGSMTAGGDSTIGGVTVETITITVGNGTGSSLAGDLTMNNDATLTLENNDIKVEGTPNLVANSSGNVALGTGNSLSVGSMGNILSGGIFYNGHYYKAFNNGSQLSWQSAEERCEALGGFLVTITSAEENDKVTSLVTGDSWIGAYRKNYGGPFYWVIASEDFSTYTNWAGGEPNNTNKGEYYAEILTNGRWNDEGGANCSSYICEWDLMALFNLDVESSIW